MSTEIQKEIPLEIAHVLLIDVVGYSKLLVNEQIELLQDLNQIVRNTECFRAAETKGKLIRVSTIARASAYPAADGSAQRPGESSHRC
jgi:hypothetical protein